jgi:phosphoribosyl 1,2-cyclic phosphodiesterase
MQQQMSRLYFGMVASGSRGNCSFLANGTTLAIVDFGISYRRFQQRIEQLGSNFDSINLFVSHEHSDHSSGIPVAIRKTKLDIYSRELTLSSLGLTDAFPIHDHATIDDLSVTAVDVSHDAADPVAYIFRTGKIKISVISDLGRVDERLIEAAKGSDIIAMEANHDVEMLRKGSYSPGLKARIEGSYGHLSNVQSAEALSEICNENTRIILTHLSQENNTQKTAMSTVKRILEWNSVKYRSIECASQMDGSSLYIIDRDTRESEKLPKYPQP